MKRIVLAGLAVILIGALGAAYSFAGSTFSAVAGSCRMDDEIPSAQRTPIDNAAMTFVAAVLGHQPQAAYPMMTQAAQSSTSPQKFNSEFNALVQRSGPYANPKIVHTYFLQAIGGKADLRVICGPLAGTDWVAVEAKPGLTQAHVLVSAQTRNNDWALTIWLLPVGSDWRVQYFHIGMSGMVGHSPDNLLELARQQRDTGHAFNANMLYAGLRAIIDRGPAFQLGIVQTAQDDFQKLKVPPEFQGQPPFVWKMGGGEYKVTQVSIIGVDGKLGLTFDLPEEDWNGNEDADKRNHAFLDAFIATHPDYSPPFSFLLARAQKPDGSGGFVTAYEAGKGYD